jgi:Flp pilus assembly protein TadD
VLAIDPGSDAALNAKGAALIQLGKFNDAIPFFDQALVSNSMNPQALDNKGVVAVG